MASELSERIAALRKERGLTQEQLGNMVGVSSQAVSKWEKGGTPDVELLPILSRQLGVTIDALFGMDGGEQVAVEDAVGCWLRGFPVGERLNQFCRLVWSSFTFFREDGIKIPKMDYLETCHPDMENGADQLMYTKYWGGGGIVLDIHAEDMSFVTLWPEPKGGYAQWFAPKNEYRCLFELLAKPGRLELLEYLNSRENDYFVPEVAADRLNMTRETVDALLGALEERQIVYHTELELSEGKVRAYRLSDPASFVPFLYMARSLMQTGMNYLYMWKTEPVLQGERWKEKETN